MGSFRSKINTGIFDTYLIYSMSYLFLLVKQMSSNMLGSWHYYFDQHVPLDRCFSVLRICRVDGKRVH